MANIDWARRINYWIKEGRQDEWGCLRIHVSHLRRLIDDIYIYQKLLGDLKDKGLVSLNAELPSTIEGP